MSQQELTWRVSIDPAVAAAGMRSLAAEAKTSTASIEASIRQEAAAAIALQRQRSAALIAQWKTDTAAAENEERKRAAAIIAIQRQQSGAVISLQRQRSAALAQELKAADAVVAGSAKDLARREVQNLTADYTVFTNALKNNSINVRKSSDDFLNLFAKVNGGGKELKAAEHEVSHLSEGLKVLAGSAVIAEGPMGGVSSRLRAMSGEASELNHVLAGADGTTGIMIGAAAGVAVLVAAVAIGGEVLFSLSEKTAQFGDDVFKAHEKTALSVETLSALKIAGKDLGIELDQMTAGFVRFTQNLEKAAAGDKKFVAEFKQLGVTAFHDNDKALQQFIARFAELRTDQERTVAAGEVFGVRFGATLVEVFNHVGGDVEAFKDKLRGMHLLMDDDTARAAHEFMVSLDRVKLELSGVARVIGSETMPAFEAMFKLIESSLEANKTDWQGWGHDLAMIILSVEAVFGGLANVIKNLSWENLAPVIGPVKVLRDFFEGQKAAAIQLADNYSAITNPTVGGDISQGISKRDFSIPPTADKKAKRDTTARDQLDTELAALKANIGEREAAYSEETANLKHQYDERLLAFTELMDAQRVANAERTVAALQSVQTEILDLRTAEQNKALTAKEAADRRIQIEKDEAKITRDARKEEQTLTEQEYKHQLQLDAEFRAAREAAAVAADDREMAQLKKLLEARAIGEVAYENAVTAVLLRTNDRRKHALDDELSELIAHVAKTKNISLAAAALEKVVTDAKAAQVARRKKLSQDEVTIEEEGATAIAEALQRRAAAYVALDTLAANQFRTRELEQRKSDLQLLIMIGGANAKTIALARQLSLDEAREHHNQVIDEINTQEAEAHAIDVGEKHKQEIRDRYRALRDQENNRFGTEQETIAPNPLADVAVNRAELILGTQLIDVFLRIKKVVHDAGAEMSVFKMAVLAVSKTAAEFFHAQSQQAGNFQTIMQSASSSVVQGLVDIGAQWILTGHTGENALRKLVAQTLSAIFQQAAIKALWEGAEALAEVAIGISLASNPFTAALAPPHFAAATAHGTAAAAYGLLAGAAAIGGRFAAGNAFQSAAGNTGGGSGGSGSSSSGGGSNANATPAAIDIGRRTEAPQIHIHLGGDLSQFDVKVLKVVHQDYKPGGKLRELVLNDGVTVG